MDGRRHDLRDTGFLPLLADAFHLELRSRGELGKRLYGLVTYIVTSRQCAMVTVRHRSDGCAFRRMRTTEGFKCLEVQHNDLALPRNATIVCAPFHEWLRA